MSDFVQTMKDWRRMCDTIKSCDDCPMQKEDGWTYVLCSEGGISSARPEVAEKVIVKWAAEHPVVYPTWEEWLVANGIMEPDNVRLNGDYRFYCNCKPVYNIPSPKMFDPIPADIAQKLGLQPKEDV